MTGRADRRVAVTGLGLLTGLGLDRESSWRGLADGRSVTRRYTLFDPDGLASPFGVELPAGTDELFAALLKPRSRTLMTRGTMIAVAAAEEATAGAGLDHTMLDRSRVGVVLGATGTGYVPPPDGPDPHRILRNMQNAPAAWVSLRKKYTGPSFVVSTACSSGAFALWAAHALIVSGQCDAVISGSADSSLNRPDVEGFSSLLALAEGGDPASASRPFDRTRNGFVMGEGGGILVLENLDFARRRGARILAEMPMPGLCSEGYNILSPRPGGVGMAEAMRRALDNAGLAPGEIDYLNAHGTSTPHNDLAETEAVKSVFGASAARLPVSSTKSMTGHCLAGAAGVEAVICCLALRDGLIPPTINLTDPDPACDLDYVPGTARRKDLAAVMSNSFAFGGHNGVVVFTRHAG